MILANIKIMKFYYVYILNSINKDFIYTGYTENLRNRLERHNSGGVTSTKYYMPFDLIFFEGYTNMKDAKRREKYLKTDKGKSTLKTMLKETFSQS